MNSICIQIAEQKVRFIAKRLPIFITVDNRQTYIIQKGNQGDGLIMRKKVLDKVNNNALVCLK
jgi:hypothetical protein